jgi:hypothetical protein
VQEGVVRGQALTALAISIIGALTLFAILRLVLRSTPRAGSVALAILAVVFVFGHVRIAAKAPIKSDRETVLLVAALVLLVTISIWIASKDVGPRFFRIVTLVLGVLTSYNAVTLVAQGGLSGHPVSAALAVPTGGMAPTAVGPARDVYYLVFDRYGGERTLEALYGFDNAPFLDGLRARGFTVTEGALANYPQTTQSLASSVNMTHLQDLAAEVGTESSSWTPLVASLQDTTASRIFRDLGYRYVYIGNWWGPTAQDPTADDVLRYHAFSEFSETVFKTTILPSAATWLGLRQLDEKTLHYDRVAAQLEMLRRTAEDPRPTYTFAHFSLPHPPYVFDRDGGFVPIGDPTRPGIEQRYLDQLVYTNTVIDDLVDTLLAGPDDQDPIIVLQSDEGPYPPEEDKKAFPEFTWGTASDVELGRRFQILQAFYFPGDVRVDVAPTHTPVNTFRLVLNAYFGADLPYLPDRSYVFTDKQHPFRYQDVTDRLRAPE